MNPKQDTNDAPAWPYEGNEVQLPVTLWIFDRNPPPDFSSWGHKKSPTTCHYQISYENQNPVDIHTSIMCINILQNIKAVALKL